MAIDLSAAFLPKRKKKAGVTASPRMVLETRPPVMTIATGWRISLPG